MRADLQILLMPMMMIQSCSTTARTTARMIRKNIINDRSLSTSGASLAKDDLKYCVELVQKRDYDAYICGLLLQDSAKPAYFASRALNVEVGSILQDTSGDMNNALGVQMRLQFWRDQLDKMYDDDERTRQQKVMATAELGTPVLRSLQRSVAASNLTKLFFDRIINARELDLEFSIKSKDGGNNIVYERVSDMELHSEYTASSLLYLSLESAGVVEGTTADIVCSQIGRSVGLVSLLKGVVYRAARGEVCIPGELMQRHNVDVSDVLNHPLLQGAQGTVGVDVVPLTSSDNLKAAVRDLAYIVRGHLADARNAQGDVPKEARACLLPAVGAIHYVDRLEQLDFDVFDEKLMVPMKNDWKHHLKLGRAWITGVF